MFTRDEYRKLAAFIKAAMGPIPAGGGADPAMAQKKLLRAQKVGTPEDPNMGIKPLNAFKMPKMPKSPGMKTAEVARGFFAKLAFSESSFSGGTHIFRPQYTSGVQPIGSRVGPASQYDPSIDSQSGLFKDGGETDEPDQPDESDEPDVPDEEREGSSREKTKENFAEAGFGHAASHGAWSGNGGHDASGLAYKAPPPASVRDPYIDALRG